MGGADSRNAEPERTRSADRLAGLAVVAAWIAAGLAILALWSAFGRYRPGGDEPSYLVIADGLARHQTLEQSRPVADEFARKRFDPYSETPPGSALTLANSHTIAGSNGHYSIHSPGLPLLLAPAAILGPFAAKALMVALTSLVVVGAWRASGLFTDQRDLRAGCVVGLTFGLPFLPASNQIFPDLLAGALALNAIVTLLNADAGRRLGALGLLGASLTAAFLPWLQIKFLAAAVLLAGGTFWFAARDLSLRAAFASLAPLIVSATGLAAYNAFAFGNALGPYEQGALQISPAALTAFLGLHFDRMQGLFVQNPLFLLGPVFLIPFARRHVGLACLMALIYAAFVVPNAMHPNWYGGGSFSGRFIWAGACIMTPVALFGLVSLLGGMSRPVWIAVIAGFSTLQAAMWAAYSTRTNLVHDTRPDAPDQSVLTPLGDWLPHFAPTEPDPWLLASSLAALAGLVAVGPWLARGDGPGRGTP
jgi:hypothetical protein